MLEHQVEEELTTVRVQDPRVQNEGSWNSYVDYKIFLHTNSKAFTAKTSCVRRRYREFVWLKKRLQKNAGLVPVPELPGKSTFFAGSTDEFIEKRRQGLQQFLEKVVQNVVLLSDSQLHLFLQSQLSIPEIEACVQGRGSLSVTDAILHYAMSNCGWVQEEDSHSALLAKGDFSSRCGTEEGAEEQKKQVSSLLSSGGVYRMVCIESNNGISYYIHQQTGQVQIYISPVVDFPVILTLGCKLQGPLHKWWRKGTSSCRIL
uniref:Sorting nexin 11 n=1 Tax=Podarcis muralis TaxID=64176 RepID=A0A670J9H2_PODMU